MYNQKEFGKPSKSLVIRKGLADIKKGFWITPKARFIFDSYFN